MAAVKEFCLPDLGEGLTEAEIVRWLVEVGDAVAVDQPVVEVETAKALVEVPCPYGGVVTARFGEPGQEIPVGSALVTVGVGERDSAAGAYGDGPVPASGPDPVPEGDRPPDPAPRVGPDHSRSGSVLVGYGTSAAPAARRRRVRQAQAALPDGSSHATRGASPGSAPASPDASSAPPPDDVLSGGPVAVISPLVRRIAREHGLDLRILRGSGPDGLILRMDVERAIAAGTAGRQAAPGVPGVSGVSDVSGTAVGGPAAVGSTGAGVVGAGPAVVGASGAESAGATVRIPLRGVRGAVAAKLARSRTEIPDATCWVDADATELLAARQAMNAVAGPGAPKVSLLALFARICLAALARYPELNSTVDTERREIVRSPQVHLGFAAQTERGLVVPVVRDAHRRTTEALAAEIARLTEAARTATLSARDLTHGTFTLNNYGVFGVDGSTPIINHPEAAMLGVGRISPKPWVVQGALAVRQVVQLSLTFDHRVCDGGTAGGFLRFVADCVERPAVLLRSV